MTSNRSLLDGTENKNGRPKSLRQGAADMQRRTHLQRGLTLGMAMAAMATLGMPAGVQAQSPITLTMGMSEPSGTPSHMAAERHRRAG